MAKEPTKTVHLDEDIHDKLREIVYKNKETSIRQEVNKILRNAFNMEEPKDEPVRLPSKKFVEPKEESIFDL